MKDRLPEHACCANCSWGEYSKTADMKWGARCIWCKIYNQHMRWEEKCWKWKQGKEDPWLNRSTLTSTR